MGYSRRTSPPHDGGSRLLSLGGHPIASTDEPDDWLDFFPAEDQRAPATNASVSTFVVDSAPIVAVESSRRRRRSHRGRLQSTLQRITRGVLLPFRLTLRGCRWVAAGVRRAAASLGSVIRRGVRRTGLMIASSLRAVMRGVTALLLLPWRLAKGVLAALRSVARGAYRLAAACQRAVVRAGVGFVGLCRTVGDAAAYMIRRALSAVASAAHAVGSLVGAIYHSVADLIGRLAAGVRRTAVLFGARVQAVVKAVAVFLHSVVMVVPAALRAMQHWLQLTIARAVQLVVETIRGAHALARTIGQSASRTAALVVTSIVSGSQRTAAWVAHGVLGTWRASGRACLNVVTFCLALATALWALWLRASRGLWQVIGKIALACRSMTRRLVEGLTGASREAARAAHMSLVVAGHGVVACYSAAGAAAALVHHHAVGVARAAETSIVEGAVGVYRTTALNMDSTVVVLRVPAVHFSLPHFSLPHPSRGHLVASALAMSVLLLVATLVPLADMTRGPAPETLEARVIPALVRTRVLRATAVTPLAPLAPAFYSAGAATSRSATMPRVALVGADHRAIRTVLNRYRDAMSTLNVSGLKTVWPNADSDAVRASFATLVDQNVEFDRCRIYLAATGATAACTGVIESGFSPGQRRPKVARARWEFRLQKSGQRWTISTVDTLPG